MIILANSYNIKVDAAKFRPIEFQKQEEGALPDAEWEVQPQEEPWSPDGAGSCCIKCLKHPGCRLLAVLPWRCESAVGPFLEASPSFVVASSWLAYYFPLQEIRESGVSDKKDGFKGNRPAHGILVFADIGAQRCKVIWQLECFGEGILTWLQTVFECGK